MNLTLKRTNSEDIHFIQLVSMLDHELWNELSEDQATYDQYNKVPGIDTVVVAYEGEKPVACGCFKQVDNNTVEIKRMFVTKGYRGRGLSKMILKELEEWAWEKNNTRALLETSIHFQIAQGLYKSNGYQIITNYPPYVGLHESICMEKQLKF